MAVESWIRRLSSSRPRRATGQRAREALRRQVDSGRLALGAAGTNGQRRHLIVCGDDPLAHRLVEELVGRYRLTVIMGDRRRGHGPQIARLPVEIVEADQLDSDAFRRAGIHRAEALALVHQDDVGNIHAALRAQDLNPKLRLVIRMFNLSLGIGIRQILPESRMLSDAAMAAPAFVSAALGEIAGVHVPVRGRTLYVARRAQARPADIVCGLAATAADGQPDLLPTDQGRADLVLAVARGGQWRAAVDARLPRWWRRPLRALSMLVGRKLRMAALALGGLLVVGTVVLKVALHTSWLDAGYLAILDALAGANPDVNSQPAVKLIETVLTIVSIALVPIVTAAVVESMVNARLLGRARMHLFGHVVVVGLGNVGTRVIQQLHDLGVPVLAIDKNENARGVSVVRELKIPYLVGEANRAETLRAASVATCQALIVVTTDDVSNLETAIQAREIKPDLRVVLRLFEGDLADRIQRGLGIMISRSVSYVAAPAFAAAMLEREVIGTIPVGRRVLLIAEVPVCAGSELDGAVSTDAGDVGEVRVIAVLNNLSQTTLWDVPPQRRLDSADILVVVATRAGLRRLLARTGTAGAAVDDEAPD